jgi:RNA polymerase sigma-70 factor (ECF subfamily)
MATDPVGGLGPEPVPELVLKAKAGDREAFERLACPHLARLRHQVQARMGRRIRSRIDADDVVQETLATALESIGKFAWQGEGSFYLWIAGIAEHIILNAVRKKGWTPIGIEQPPAGPATTTPSKLARRDERFGRLQGGLRRLTTDQRNALRLSREEGLKVAEIAARMGRSPNAVYKLLARALIELRNDVGDTGSLHLPDRALDFGGNENPKGDENPKGGEHEA